MQNQEYEHIKEYYGCILQTQKDLKTSACCTTDGLPDYLSKIVSQIDREVLEKFYGGGSPIPPALEGCTVLDLGCGTGRDVSMVSALVGEGGRAVGVDMTDEQLEVARRHQHPQAQKFGFSRSNVEFKAGYIENLQAIGLKDNSIDVVISNCVINLSPDKKAVFKEILRVLKPGGELYFSDIFAGRRISQEVQADPVLAGECLAGALYVEDFRRLLRQLGCLDYRVVAGRRISLNDSGIEAKIGMIEFHSLTIRAFKLADLEDICEDYGQVAQYLGTIPECPHQFLLDDHHLFEKGRPMLVCGNTAAMVSDTRYGKHFEVAGNRQTHFGPFPCAPVAKAVTGKDNGACSCSG